MKELKDYIHFYIGCKCQTISRTESEQGKPMGYRVGNLVDVDILCLNVGISRADTGCIWYKFDEIKPILRPLSDMTEKERNFINMSKQELDQSIFEDPNASFYVTEFVYLLSRGFDIFGLIDAGLAIDSKTLK